MFWLKQNSLLLKDCIIGCICVFKNHFTRSGHIICDCLSKNQPSSHLPVLWETNSIWENHASPWYWTHSLSIIILNYLLAFVQLTWQEDNGWFHQFLMIFSWNVSILGQCIYGGWWQRLKQRSKITQMVESLEWLWHPHVSIMGQYSTTIKA